MNVERLSLWIVKRPEAQRNVEVFFPRDWAPVCGREEWLALLQTWDLLGPKAHAQVSVFESSPCFNSITISRVITFVSLWFASRTEKLLQVYWPFYSEPAFSSLLETAVSPRGAWRLQTAVLNAPTAVLKCQLPQGCRKPSLSTAFLERQTPREKKYFGWLQWSNLSWPVVCTQDTIYWGPDLIPHSRSSSLVISYNVLSSSWVPCPCPMPFTDLIYTFLFMFFNKIWPEVFQQKIGYIFLLPVNEQRVCQEIVLIFQQSEEKQVSCQLLFLLAIHPWNTADSSICYPWEFQREIALTRQSSPELTPQNSDVQVTWEVLWILLRKFVIW